MSSLTILGTGTCQIEHERRASSVLLELDGMYTLFDCGHGVIQRLLEAGVQHNQVHHIVFSHFHPDHVSDLIPFLHAGAWSRRNPRTTDVHIYGPQGLSALISGLFAAFGASNFERPGYSVVVHEVSEECFSIGRQVFEFVSLPPAGNHGLRFTYHGKCYAITGDSYFHEQEIAFLSGVDLAIIDSGHIEDDEIAALAAASQPTWIICSHLYREIDAGRLEDLAVAKGYTGVISVGRDLQTIAL